MNKAITVIFLVFLTLPLQAGDIKIDRLTTEMQEGFALVEGNPRLSWTMQSEENGTNQTAYEIEIYELYSKRIVWNSGKVNSSQSQLVSTQGLKNLPHSSDNTYACRVLSWGEANNHTAW